MKKKILMLACALVMVFSVTSCGSSIEEQDEIYGLSKIDIESQMESVGNELSAVDSATAGEYRKQMKNAYETQTGEQKMQAKIYMDLFESYEKDADLLGEFKDFGEFSIDKAGKTITCTLEEKFSKRDAELVFVYKIVGERMKLTAINVNPVYSMGETMGKAGLNVLTGMLVVFGVLILISLVIWSFKLISIFENRNKQVSTPKEKAEESTASVSEPANGAIDPEVVAVIIAAIKASTEEQTDNFVVRSIKRR